MDAIPGDPWIWGWAFFTGLAACVGIWMLRRAKDRPERAERAQNGGHHVR